MKITFKFNPVFTFTIWHKIMTLPKINTCPFPQKFFTDMNDILIDLTNFSQAPQLISNRDNFNRWSFCETIYFKFRHNFKKL